MRQFKTPGITKASARQALDNACAIAEGNLPLFSHRMQANSSVGGIYPPGDNTDWTDGFWPGVLWLAYEHTGGQGPRTAALSLCRLLEGRIRARVAVDHHDLGFLYSPSCVAAHQLTGDESCRQAALLAADHLLGRFQPIGQFLQAWGRMDAPENYRYIIDCLLNLPLLFWAGKQTGEDRYADTARRHIATCLANSIRPDGSTYHTFFMDAGTGAPSHGATCQGYRDDSFWARGQAWAVYGLALALRHTGDEALVALFQRVLDFYLSRLPDDLVPYWDMLFTDGSAEPRDSSSACIVACGLLEMAGHVDAKQAESYTALASQMLHSLHTGYAAKRGAPGSGLVLHGTYCKSSPHNSCPDTGVDECVSWGDYFYMEALTRFARDWQPYW